MDRAFYTYTIFIDGVPVYVGKGKDIRCFDHLYEKPELMEQPLQIKVEWAASAAEALDREKELIAAYAPHGTLLNEKMNPFKRGTRRPFRRPVEPEIKVKRPTEARPHVRWGPKGRRKFIRSLVPVESAAQDLSTEAAALLVHCGSPYWFKETDRWLADHAHYEDQFTGWPDGPSTGFAQVMAARRRCERVLDHARAWCKDVPDEEFSFRFGMLVEEHPWLDSWLGWF
ncbi:hypothetical protein LHP98_05260 [Rhodobacter sp. Har01]|uniref:hypothetical protein n=1 Tax=Rhodobacter sp. Har01 TaxID=2883999 RepID=UPI001D09664B|nr:hypothetical protein [Rhodobacter sp. Har01]MCB6177538.1 hypothetical protein [Rhodobacter sp. Har01]